MRMLMYIACPIEPFNSGVRGGSAGQKIQKILEALKPEAAYFHRVAIAEARWWLTSRTRPISRVSLSLGS